MEEKESIEIKDQIPAKPSYPKFEFEPTTKNWEIVYESEELFFFDKKYKKVRFHFKIRLIKHKGNGIIRNRMVMIDEHDPSINYFTPMFSIARIKEMHLYHITNKRKRVPRGSRKRGRWKRKPKV